MAHRSDSNCISTEREYGAARRELDALRGLAGPPDECRIDELIELDRKLRSVGALRARLVGRVVPERTLSV